MIYFVPPYILSNPDTSIEKYFSTAFGSIAYVNPNTNDVYGMFSFKKAQINSDDFAKFEPLARMHALYDVQRSFEFVGYKADDYLHGASDEELVINAPKGGVIEIVDHTPDGAFIMEMNGYRGLLPPGIISRHQARLLYLINRILKAEETARPAMRRMTTTGPHVGIFG